MKVKLLNRFENNMAKGEIIHYEQFFNCNNVFKNRLLQMRQWLCEKRLVQRNVYKLRRVLYIHACIRISVQCSSAFGTLDKKGGRHSLILA